MMIDTDPDVIIFDVRTGEEYDSGHIDRAVLIPVSELERRAGELDRKKRILVYCRSGNRSRTASEILIRQEFHWVYNILGGINAWAEAKYPVVTASRLAASTAVAGSSPQQDCGCPA